MSSRPETRRIPPLLVVYPVVSAIIFGWSVLASLGLPILIGIVVARAESRFHWDWSLAVVAVVYVVSFLFSVVFLLSSIGVLWRRQKWLSTFRRCAIVLNVYLVLCPALAAVAIPFMATKDRKLALTGLVLMASLAAAVTLVTRRLLKHLSDRDVVALFR